MTNVVELPTASRPRVRREKTFTNGTSKFRVSDDVLNVLRLRIYNYDTRDLADAVGVSISCINSIRSGRTKWPRGETFFQLIAVLGIEIHLFDVERGKYL